MLDAGCRMWRAAIRHPASRICCLVQDHHSAFAPLQRRLHGIAEPDADLLVHHQPVHHHVDRMPQLRIELDADVAAQLDQFPIDAGAHEAFAGQPLDDVAEFAFLFPHDRRQQHHAGLGRQGEDAVHDVAGGLGDDGLAGLGAMRLPDMGVEQAEIIEDLGGGGDDGPRVGAGAALLDGDRGREALDVVHVRFLQLVEELPGIRGEAFDVLALALGVDGVEGERGLARSAQAGDDHQLVARDVQREVLQVVLTRTADPDEFLCHNRRIVRRQESASIPAPARKSKGMSPEGSNYNTGRGWIRSFPLLKPGAGALPTLHRKPSCHEPSGFLPPLRLNRHFRRTRLVLARRDLRCPKRSSSAPMIPSDRPPRGRGPRTSRPGS